MIKNVIYDMGAVLYDIDYSLTATAFKELGFTNFNAMYSQFAANEIFAALEKGKITEDAFYTLLKKSAPKDVTCLELKNAWNAMLLGFRPHSLKFLNEIAKTKNIFLLSNTNAIHLEKVLADYAALDLPESYEALFTQAWYSHEVHLRKPEVEIYEYVLAEAALNPAETLFIDDTQVNIITAEKLGIKVHWFKAGETIEDLDYEQYN